MDYRHTEDFARRMELAELQAHALRDEAIGAFFAAAGRAVRRAWHAVVARLAHRSRADSLLPEA
jgi:hypothetical protein